MSIKSTNVTVIVCADTLQEMDICDIELVVVYGAPQGMSQLHQVL